MNDSEEILDDSPIKKHKSIREMILWWEYRRILFNALIIIFSVYSLYVFWDYSMFHMTGHTTVILEAVTFIIGLNICYTISWGVGVISVKLLKGQGYSSTQRWIVFSIGILFALFLTNMYFVLASDAMFAF